MKKVIIILSAIALIASSCGTKKQEPVGVYVGQSDSEFREIFEQRYKVKGSIEWEGVYEVFENDEVLFAVEMDAQEGVVYRILVSSPQIKTERGIGVGSTAAELQSKYDFDGSTYDGGFADVKDFSGGSFQLGQTEPESPKVVSLIYLLDSSLILTTDKRIITRKVKTPSEIELGELSEALGYFIPQGFTILSATSGDLNRDKYEDMILVVERKGEMGEFVQEEDRALLILLGQADGNYKLAARNDKVVYNSYEGGSLGDAFQKIVIKNGYFSVENMGGSREMWTRIITFKYSENDKDWFLHKDGGDIIDRLEPDNMKTEVKTTKDFGEKVSFKDFDRNKDYRLPILITAAGVDIFEYGKPIPFDNSRYTIVKDTCRFDGNEWFCFMVYQNGEELLRIDIDFNDIYNENYNRNNSINRLTVLSNKFVTAEGIRVGSTIEEFFRAYPNSNIYYSELSADYWVSSDDESQNRSVFAVLSLPENFVYPDVANLKMSDFKGAKIIEMSMYGNR